MEFIVTEKNGSTPIDDWLASQIKDHAKKKFGIELNITIEKEEQEGSE